MRMWCTWPHSSSSPSAKDITGVFGLGALWSTGGAGNHVPSLNFHCWALLSFWHPRMHPGLVSTCFIQEWWRHFPVQITLRRELDVALASSESVTSLLAAWLNRLSLTHRGGLWILHSPGCSSPSWIGLRSCREQQGSRWTCLQCPSCPQILHLSVHYRSLAYRISL